MSSVTGEQHADRAGRRGRRRVDQGLALLRGQGLLHKPDRTPGGYRDYEPGVVGRVTFIRQAQAAGLTLRQIAEVLQVRDGGRAPCGHVERLVDDRLADVEERLAELVETRTQLRELRARLSELYPADCPPDEICIAVSRTMTSGIQGVRR